MSNINNMLITSLNRNNYILDEKKDQILLCHPAMKSIIESAGKDGESSSYYHKKYSFLKEHGYFQNYLHGQIMEGRLKISNFEEFLANSRQVIFETTENCNLMCTYCTYGPLYNNYGKRERFNLSVEKAKKLIEFLAKRWNSSINTSHKKEIFIAFYGGEPLLNMDFIRAIVKKTKDLDLKHNTFSYTMTTNGTLLDKHMDYFVHNDFFLTISLDGNEKNNGFRFLSNGKGSFSKVVSNIESLKKKYPAYFERKVFFNAVLHSKNSYTEITEFFNKRYNKIPSITEVSPVGVEPERYNDFLNVYPNKFEQRKKEKCNSLLKKKEIKSSINELRQIIRNYNRFMVWEFNDLFYSFKPMRLPTGTCIPFQRRLFITAQGVLLPCERVGHQYKLGNFNEDILLDFDTITNNYNSYFDKMSTLCKKCYFNKLCNQCIFQLDLDSSKPLCPNFMNKRKYEEYFMNQIGLLEKQPKQYIKITKETVGINI